MVKTEGGGAGGARRDPDHSHEVDPRWSQQRKDKWERRPGWRQRADEPGRRGGFGGPRWSRCAQATKAQTGIRKAAVEPEWQRTKVELEGGRSPTEPEGQRDEVKPHDCSPEVREGRRPTKAEPEGQGSPAELEDLRVTQMRELGAMVEPMGRWAEVESRTQRLRRRQGILQSWCRWRLADPWQTHNTDGGLRLSWGTGIMQQQRGRRWHRTHEGMWEREAGREFRIFRRFWDVCAAHTHQIMAFNTGAWRTGERPPWSWQDKQTVQGRQTVQNQSPWSWRDKQTVPGRQTVQNRPPWSFQDRQGVQTMTEEDWVY